MLYENSRSVYPCLQQLHKVLYIKYRKYNILKAMKH